MRQHRATIASPILWEILENDRDDNCLIMMRVELCAKDILKENNIIGRNIMIITDSSLRRD